MGRIMKRDQPGTPDEWLEEIRLAMAYARNTKPFGLLTGQVITDSNLFHLAPLVCMKFRGLDSRKGVTGVPLMWWWGRVGFVLG